METQQKFVVVADAIAGRGVVLMQGLVVTEEELWGMSKDIMERGGVRLATEEEALSMVVDPNTAYVW